MLTSKQRAILRGKANTMDPVFIVGKGEIDETMIQGVKDCLEARELIKLKVLENSMYNAREASIKLAEATGADCVQVIGSKFVLYLQKKKEKELSDREAAITRKELMAEAKNTLAEKNLPAGLAEVLNYADAESCNKSIAAVEKAFQAAVEAAVQERLKGGTPPKKAPETNTQEALEKQVYNAMMGIF